MAGWKDFAFEWRERGTAYPAATASHIAIYGDETQTLYTIDDTGVPANHHMGHLEVVAGATSWRMHWTNEAWGSGVLESVTTGQNNTGVGAQALAVNEIGNDNTAVGLQTLGANISGSGNTAVGLFSLASNTDGNFNVAYGSLTLFTNSSGSSNVAIGSGALYGNTTGSGNVAIGYNAGYDDNGSNKLYITNSYGTSGDALIYGEFDTKRLYIGGSLNVMQTLTISGNSPLTVTLTPPTSSSYGVPNTIAYDNDYLYVCIAQDTWKRAALLPF